MAWFDLPKAIRARLLADATLAPLVGTRVHYQEIPEHSTYPHIWFSRNGRERNRCLGDEDCETTERYSLEIVGDADCETIVDRVVALLESMYGEFGEVGSPKRNVQFVEIEDADDEYVFKSVGEGEPDYLHALQVTVIHVPN